YDEMLLWFEHDLFDQLNLIHLLSWIHERLPGGKPLRLICIGSFPGRPAFKGLGELTPPELASLIDARQPVTAAPYDLDGRTCRAWRGPSPEALEAMRRADTSALPYLAPAIDRFLQEFPGTHDGLSRSERQLLRLAERGAVPVAAAFPRMHDGEDAYYITDLSLAALVETLSRTSPPLLTVIENGDGHRGALRGAGSVTEAGRAVPAQPRARLAG